MRHYVTIFLKRLAVVLEFVISIMLAIGIVLLCLRMATSLSSIPNLDVWPNYDDLLETCFNLIIGVELIRMMYSHTPSTVFEVLLFAIRRTRHSESRPRATPFDSQHRRTFAKASHLYLRQCECHTG